MVDRNDYKIIINKGKTKEKFFLFLTVGEMGFCLFIGVLSFKFFGMFMTADSSCFKCVYSIAFYRNTSFAPQCSTSFKTGMQVLFYFTKSVLLLS